MQAIAEANNLREWSATTVRNHYATNEYERQALRPGAIRHSDGVIEIPDGDAILMRAARHLVRGSNDAENHKERSWYSSGLVILYALFNDELPSAVTSETIQKILQKDYAENHR